MALDPRPGFSAGEFFTEQAAAIQLVYDQIVDVHKQACPTLKILLANKKGVDLGPDGLVRQNFIHDMYNVSHAAFNQRFGAPDLDPISQMQYSTEQIYTSAATNDIEMKRYGSDHSRIDLVNEKVQAMHAGLTWVENYMLFSDWSESLAGDEIDIQSELSNAPVPPPVKFESLTAHGNRMYSIPMVIRDNDTTHVFGNVSSGNALWRSTISIDAAATVTRNGTAYDATTNPQANVVTDDNFVTVTLDLDLLRTHLNIVSRGYGYELYAACPASLYGVLEDLLLAERRRDASRETELAELGINASFTYNAYNVVFYVDPMMTDLWPGTIWFYDPSVMFLLFDNDFDPAKGTGVYSWMSLPGTTQHMTALYGDGQLICLDRRGVSAIHGVAA